MLFKAVVKRNAVEQSSIQNRHLCLLLDGFAKQNLALKHGPAVIPGLAERLGLLVMLRIVILKKISRLNFKR